MRHRQEISDERLELAKKEAAVLLKILRILEPLTPRERVLVLAMVKVKIDLEGEWA